MYRTLLPPSTLTYVTHIDLLYHNRIEIRREEQKFLLSLERKLHLTGFVGKYNRSHYKVDEAPLNT